MKRKNVVALTLMFLLAAGAFLLFVPGPQASAQQNCTEIRALLQLTLPSSYMLAPATDVWGGPAFATLGGEPLVGGISGTDGEGFRHGARGGQYQVYLCSTNLYPQALELPPACQDSFTYEVPTSLFLGLSQEKQGSASTRATPRKLFREQASLWMLRAT